MSSIHHRIRLPLSSAAFGKPQQYLFLVALTTYVPKVLYFLFGKQIIDGNWNAHIAFICVFPLCSPQSTCEPLPTSHAEVVDFSLVEFLLGPGF